ncbi:MAG: tRNA pseudouridine(55) synthase TruB [Limnochordaceae bacterium]|nr:tRNA pseudouridine(55) synthase TruB [Limnochordaceae bacterium]
MNPVGPHGTWGQPLHGFLLVNKPVGPTSHDVVACVRRRCPGTRVGHLGTLDPAAHGLLPLALGLATRLAEYAHWHSKQYRAEWWLGRETDSGDLQGLVVAQAAAGSFVTAQAVRAALVEFQGEIEQVPPAASAVRVAGRHSYEWVRAGLPRPLPPRSVRIWRLEWLGWRPQPGAAWQRPPDAPAAPIHAGERLLVELDCSAGTYVRALAKDVGRRLGLGATVADLCRTRVGPFVLEQAHPLEELMYATPQQLAAWLQPLDDILPLHWRRVVLHPAALARVVQGGVFSSDEIVREPEGERVQQGEGNAGAGRGETPSLPAVQLEAEDGWLAVLDPEGRLRALARQVKPGVWHPEKVLTWEDEASPNGCGHRGS